MQYLNKDMCKLCGGACCKRSGCMYLPEDFESMKYESLINLINKGNISISAFEFDLFDKGFNENGYYSNFLWSYYLYLRVRNKYDNIINFSYSEGVCTMLDENGCKFNDLERPSLGLSLIPSKEIGKDCEQVAFNYYYEIMYDWIKYQDVLEKIVYDISHKSSIKLYIEKFNYKNEQNYINPQEGFKKLCKNKDIKIDENVNVKKLVLN